MCLNDENVLKYAVQCVLKSKGKLQSIKCVLVIKLICISKENMLAQLSHARLIAIN